MLGYHVLFILYSEGLLFPDQLYGGSCRTLGQRRRRRRRQRQRWKRRRGRLMLYPKLTIRLGNSKSKYVYHRTRPSTTLLTFWTNHHHRNYHHYYRSKRRNSLNYRANFLSHDYEVILVLNCKETNIKCCNLQSVLPHMKNVFLFFQISSHDYSKNNFSND